ncbi:MAG: Coenzyme F420 hydrogenase/dehydrogenase, beta subunit C-terminal domain [Lachnospiraceae bacterium]
METKVCENQAFSIICYGAKTRDEELREKSTSGGIFGELASEWFREGGICCGAEFDDKNDVVHVIEETEEGIERLRQSKYVQSDTEGIYGKVLEKLKKGLKVMFCGCPCQVDALNNFIGSDNPGLFTMDFVCCGICSPAIYRLYLADLEKKYHSNVKSVWFKNKQKGWRSIGTLVEFQNGKKYFRTGYRDSYMVAFVYDGLSMRRSCQSCRYRKIPHKSDITVADFWGIEKVNPQMDDNKGISALIINSEKGMFWFEKIKDRVDYFDITIDKIAQGNFTIYQPKEKNPLREDFFRDCHGISYNKAISKYSSYSGIEKLKSDVKYNLSECKRRIKGK